jgi:hypothetical protein
MAEGEKPLSTGSSAVVGDNLLWRVEVEMPTGRRWNPLSRRRLRRTLAASSEVIQVRSLRPLLEGLVLRSTAPSIVVDVLADSPGAAAKRAEQAVSRALTEIGHEPTVQAHIISTDGERAPPAARRHG